MMTSSKIRITSYTTCLAIIAGVVWNFLPMWFLKDSLSEPMLALWIWGVFPLSIPIFYAFIDRFVRRQSK